MDQVYAGAGAGQARRRATVHRARRIALVGVVAGAILLLVGTATTFTATNNSVTVSPGTSVVSPAVYTSGAPPSSLGNSITAPTDWVTGTTSPIAPSWAPTLNTVVSNTTEGDIAIVDTTNMSSSSTAIITVTLGNAGGLSQAYSYLILPVAVDSWSSPTWGVALDSTSTAISTQYLSLTNGYLQYFVPGGQLYEIVMPTGGSIYTIKTSGFTGTGSLSPTFNVTVTSA